MRAEALRGPTQRLLGDTTSAARRPRGESLPPLQLYCNAVQGKPQRNVEPTIARRGPGAGGEDPSPLSRSRM